LLPIEDYVGCWRSSVTWEGPLVWPWLHPGAAEPPAWYWLYQQPLTAGRVSTRADARHAYCVLATTTRPSRLIFGATGNSHSPDCCCGLLLPSEPALWARLQFRRMCFDTNCTGAVQPIGDAL